MLTHEQEASQHHLHKPHTQNSSLVKASAVKEQRTAMKQQCKAELINVDIQLWVYPVDGKQMQKVTQFHLSH